MITVKVDADRLLRSLERLTENFQRESTRAVMRQSSEIVGDVVAQTLKFPPPKGNVPTYYERTFRLVHGWGPAAKFFNIPLPPLTSFAGTSADEGMASLYEDANKTIFHAENQVPYAKEVENDPGPWDNPLGPHAEPANFRGGYYIVSGAMENAKSENHFPQYVRDAWKLAKDAS